MCIRDRLTTTAKQRIKMIAPALRAIAANAVVKDEPNTDKIITEDKKSSIADGGKQKVDWRKVADPFEQNLKAIKKSK